MYISVEMIEVYTIDTFFCVDGCMYMYASGGIYRPKYMKILFDEKL